MAEEFIKIKNVKVKDQVIGRDYALYCGDSCEILRAFRTVPSIIPFSPRRLKVCIPIQTAIGILETAGTAASFMSISGLSWISFSAF